MAKKTDKTSASRQTTYRASMAALGFYPLQVYLPATARAMVIEIAADARSGHTILKRY